MSKETELRVCNWQSDDCYASDELHRHFTSFGEWHWCDIADEARRMNNLMFDEDVESESPRDGIWSAAAAAAAHGAYKAVAAALGINGRALELVVSTYAENQHQPPEPMSFEQLLESVAEHDERLTSRCRPNAEAQLPPEREARREPKTRQRFGRSTAATCWRAALTWHNRRAKARGGNPANEAPEFEHIGPTCKWNEEKR